MTVIGITMVRDEADIIGHTIIHLLEQGVDHIIAADNLSTDATRSILEGFDDVTVLTDDEPAYDQARKMTDLHLVALGMGADWVLPFDADEWWYAKDGGTLGEFFAACTADVVRAWGFDHIAKRDCLGNPYDEMVHRREEPQRFPKVAFRPHPKAWIAFGNHDVDRPGPVTTGLAYRHFQYRSLEQLTRKVRQGTQALEACPNLTDSTGTHWRQAAALTDDELETHWRTLCAEPGLIYDPVPQ